MRCGAAVEGKLMMTTSFRVGSVAVPGTALGYSVEGAGAPVLVVGSRVYYRRTFSRRVAGFCTLAFADLRHFAPCDPEYDFGGLTFDSYADDIDRVRAALGFERCVVVGHSKHGNIALEYAKRYPERASGVVMIGSPPFGGARVVEARDAYWETHASEDRKAAHRRNWQSLTDDRLARMSPAEVVEARYVADGPKYWYDPDYDATPLWRDVFVNSDALDRLHELFRGYEMSWSPDQLRSPVLAVIGRYDFAVPHTLWDAPRAGLSSLTYTLFERSGHTPQLEEPERFDRLLLTWLRGDAAEAQYESAGLMNTP
jgi:proline iminopeptidase